MGCERSLLARFRHSQEQRLGKGIWIGNQFSDDLTLPTATKQLGKRLQDSVTSCSETAGQTRAMRARQQEQDNANRPILTWHVTMEACSIV